MILDVFKIGVWKREGFDLDLEAIENHCHKLRQLDTVGRKLSNQGGWQSDFIEDEQPFEPLYEILKTEAQEYVTALGLNAGPFERDHIHSLWVNINGYGHTNSMHDHPDSLISGVFYVNKPESSGDIIFESPAISLVSAYWHSYMHGKHSEYHNSRWGVSCKTGNLVLFPSFLRHSVQKNENKTQERISISFNIG